MSHINMITFPSQDGSVWYVAPNKVSKITAEDIDNMPKDCKWCKALGCFAVQDVIQFGFDCDTHTTTFYCPSCLCCSTFVYQVESE